ncbi:hypothetical protein IPZ61_17855 [Streptomyces sioyaensis]|nr:hypothetical protein [Streptomyces sioyaensis]
MEFSAQAGGCLLGGGFDQFTEGGDVRLGSRVVVEVGAEGVSCLVPGGAWSLAAGGGVLFGLTGFEARLDLGQGEVRGDLSAGVEDLLVVLVEVAGASGGVAEEVTQRSPPGLDSDALRFKVGEEFLGIRDVRDGGTDAVFEPLLGGLIPAETFGLVHLGLGG